ncbi:hypothetical protein NHL51_01185 [Leucobacter sp. gxy201]|uniref:hypothetical protein n=1 Tax=Leucobacter sp. gxy201 TaxID=2957200 RepID=UPI003DA0C0BA
MIAWAESPKVDFDCGFADILCAATESQANWMVDVINWLAEAVLEDEGLRPGDSLWSAVTSEAGLWLGMSIFVMFITFIVGVAAGAVMQRPELIKRSLISTALSLPAFYFAFFIVGEGLRVIDEFTGGLLTRLVGEDGFAALIEALFEGDVKLGVVGAMVSPPIGRMMVVIVLMAIGMVLIAVAMAFRDFALMILITFAPLAFVLMPAKGLDDVWSKRWVSAVTAMALAKPLIYGVLILTMAGFREVETVWSFKGLTLGIGFIMAAFMPIAVYGFFQFMDGGSGGDQIGQRAGSMATQKAQQTTSVLGRAGAKAGHTIGRGASKAPGGRAAGGGGQRNGNGSTPAATQPNAESQAPKPARPGAGPASSGRMPESGAKPPSSAPRPPAAPRSPQVPKEPKR